MPLHTHRGKSYGFAIIAIYVDDRNIVGTLDEVKETASYMESELR